MAGFLFARVVGRNRQSALFAVSQNPGHTLIISYFIVPLVLAFSEG